MEHRTLDINVIAAKGLKDVNFVSKMEVYAVVSIYANGALMAKHKTAVDREGGTNPTWNHPVKFVLGDLQNRLNLVFRIRCNRTLGDKDIGEVHVPVKELLDAVKKDGSGAAAATQFVSYQVRTPSGKAKGELNFSYKLGEKVGGGTPATTSNEPVMAYPPPSVGYHAPHQYVPPPPPPLGYPYPASGYPHPGQGVYPPPPPPPPQAGYGYPPQGGYVQQPARKNKMGMGLGAGLLGGALGGLLIGDMLSDNVGFGGDFGF